MKLKILLFSFFTVSLVACITPVKQQASKAMGVQPNIILILADDLGYSDLGCYGGEIQTPNLDKLATSGIRYANFYNTSRCCPTRAALLTGVYNHNAGIGKMTTDEGLPGYRGFLTNNTVTLAEVLKNAGYSTGMVGKWHVSNTIEQPTAEAQMRWLNHQESHPLFSPVEQYPTNRGFDRYFGNIWGVVDFFDPFSLVCGTTPIKSVPKNYYHTDAISDTAVQYINDFSKNGKPFFLYVAETAPHWPLHALPQDIKKYEHIYKTGWDAIREKRYQNMVRFGLIDSATTKLSPRIQSELTWNNNPDKEWDARAMAVHAAMVDRMDQGIGRIVEALKKNGQLENTLILFLNDNGASPENAMRYGPGFDRPSGTRDGQKIVYPTEKKVMPEPQTTFTSIGERWANVANTPYRFAKASSYEGGVRTPMIAYWPNVIKNKGAVLHTLGHVMDFMATFVEIAHANYPAVYNGEKVQPTSGLSLMASFKDVNAKGHPVLFNEHFGAKYVRDREWKLVAQPNQPWKLYKISDDETELNDITAIQPDVAKRLERLWQQWANNNNVFPKK